MSNCFKGLTNLFDLIPESLYSSVSTSEKIIFTDSISTYLENDKIPKVKPGQQAMHLFLKLEPKDLF